MLLAYRRQVARESIEIYAVRTGRQRDVMLDAAGDERGRHEIGDFDWMIDLLIVVRSFVARARWRLIVAIKRGRNAPISVTIALRQFNL